MRKLMCRIGWHSTFTQDDKWGVARVCRYCSGTRPCLMLTDDEAGEGNE